MKDIIKISVKCKKGGMADVKADLLAVGIFKDAKKLSKANALLNSKLSGALKRLIDIGDFKGGEGESTLVYGDGKIGAARVLLVGLGESKKVTADKLRDGAAIAAAKAVELKAGDCVIAIHAECRGKVAMELAGRAMAEGAFVGGYRYDEFITNNKNGRGKSLRVSIVESDDSDYILLCKGVKVGGILGQSQSFARTISNRPGNVINPPKLAEIAKKMAKGTAGLSCKVFNEAELKQKKMGGILAVGSGSKSESRLIVLRYKSRAAKGKKLPLIGLVGKAITFDSGGISIKPSAGMQDMKFDKSGGIAVLGAMKAIAELKPAVDVIGIIPSAENMPGGTSYRPGDIVTTYSGKTVEVQNTDAEGRMILCDGLHYAVEQKCDRIVDIATLTGACMVALGKYKAGLMGNDEKMIEELKKASEKSGEKVWHMPSGEEYLEEMKSKIADLKNTGSKWGGACTAAAFLGAFIGETKWAHIDMAGVDMFDNGQKYGSAGATGFGVRLLTEFVLNSVDK